LVKEQNKLNKDEEKLSKFCDKAKKNFNNIISN